MTFTYDISLASDTHIVRFLLQDTTSSTALLQDEEIAWALSTEANVYMAAALLAENISTRFRGVGTRKVGDLSISYADAARDWAAIAARLRVRGSLHMTPSAGGINVADRDSIWEDTSLLRPEFFGELHRDPESMTTTRHPLSSEEEV